MFHFGEIQPHPTGNGTIGSHALHIQCSWRIVRPDGVVTGYTDSVLPVGEADEVNPEDWESGKLQRAKLSQFMGNVDPETRSMIDRQGSRTVVSVNVDTWFTLDIGMSDGSHLHAFPDCSQGEDWRFIAMKPDQTTHLVIAAGKIERD